eukprot:gene22392-29501_t
MASAEVAAPIDALGPEEGEPEVAPEPEPEPAPTSLTEEQIVGYYAVLNSEGEEAASAHLCEILQLMEYRFDARLAIKLDYAMYALEFSQKQSNSLNMDTVEGGSPREAKNPLVSLAAKFFSDTFLHHYCLYHLVFSEQQGFQEFTQDLLVETSIVPTFDEAIPDHEHEQAIEDAREAMEAGATAKAQAEAAAQAELEATQEKEMKEAAEQERLRQLERKPATLDEAIQHLVATRLEEEKAKLAAEYQVKEDELASKLEELKEKGFPWITNPLACSLLSLLMLIASSHLATASPWETIHQQTPTADGGGTHPSIRYGHSANPVGEEMVVTHGYFYDHDQKGNTPPAPAGRFGHATASYNGDLYMYGGHDGGFAGSGPDGQLGGSDFDDVWKLDIKTGNWTQLHPEHYTDHFLPDGNESGTPGPRYLASSAVVGDMLVLYGGLQEDQGDVWGLNLTSNKWELLSEEIDHEYDSQAPGRRAGHTLTAIKSPWHRADHEYHDGQTGGVLLYDHLASNHVASGHAASDHLASDHVASNHVASDHVASNHLASDHVASDRLASYPLSSDHLASNHVASYSHIPLPQITWQKLPDLPFGIYDAKAIASSSSIFTFGGHLCTESQGEHLFHYVNEVYRLDLTESVQVPKQAGPLSLSRVTAVLSPRGPLSLSPSVFSTAYNPDSQAAAAPQAPGQT